MKLLIANYRYFLSGGPERYLFNLEKELSARGHQVVPFSVQYPVNRPTPYARYFVSPLGDPDAVYFREQKLTPATLTKTMSRLFYSREVAGSVSRLVRDTRPQAAYILHYLRKISPSLLTALKKQDIPILVRLSDYAMLCPQTHCIRNSRPCTLCMHGSLLDSVRYNCVTGGRAAAILNVLATWFHRFMGYFDLIDTFVTTNPFMAEMMARAGWPEQKITCIPTFTDTEKFSPLPPAAKQDELTFSGRLEPIKGADLLIRAFALFRQDPGRPFVLNIAGGGDPDTVNALKAQALDLGVAHRVRFLGKLDDRSLAQVLARSRLTIVPSICFENLPNTLLESLACGTPVLASDLGSLSKAILPGKTGDLFRPGDAEDLALKIQYYTALDPGLANMATLARQQAMQDYSAETHLNRLEQAINRLI